MDYMLFQIKGSIWSLNYIVKRSMYIPYNSIIFHSNGLYNPDTNLKGILCPLQPPDAIFKQTSSRWLDIAHAEFQNGNLRSLCCAHYS